MTLYRKGVRHFSQAMSSDVHIFEPSSQAAKRVINEPHIAQKATERDRKALKPPFSAGKIGIVEFFENSNPSPHAVQDGGQDNLTTSKEEF